MKKQSYAEMATKAFSKYILDDAALKKLHACLLIITDDVDKACRKYSIKYMLSGGSWAVASVQSVIKGLFRGTTMWT